MADDGVGLNRSMDDNGVDSDKSMDEELVELYRSMDADFAKVNGARKFPYEDLISATNNFSEKEKLGVGGFGAVYRGFLKQLNSYVAVKRVSSDSTQGIKEYASEVKIISQLRHKNIVQLIGWCHERKELLLVYEFMANSSLDSHLFKENSFLTWEVRYKIARDVASGLLYLHQEWEQYVVHRDIKASNVMLDSNFNAKIGDFGLARLGDHGRSLANTTLAGTVGYVAPEYATTGKASKESDVFSFGSVALEIACGRKVINRKATKEDEINLREWVWDLYGGGKLLEAVDWRLNGEFDKQQVERLMIVGLWCVHPYPNLRPRIEKAIHVLNFVAPLPDLPSKMPMVPFLSSPSMSSYGADLMKRKNQSPSDGYNGNFSKPKKSGEVLFGAPFEGFVRLFKFGFRRETSEQVKVQVQSSKNHCRIFSFDEIKSATNNFDKALLIGSGYVGKVYKGYIDGGSTIVAIKRVKLNFKHMLRELQNEMSILSKLRHRHLVSLIGYAMKDEEMILVYNYMSQGSLSHHLYNQNSPLPWMQRLKICIGVARGLHYLHTGTENAIIHRNIKSSIILLDYDLEAKVSAFIFSKEAPYAESETETHVTTVVKGTFGFLDPEYFRRGKLTEKSDVYSFGVVLFEILCARHPIQVQEDDRKVNLANWALYCYKMGTLDQIIDPYLEEKIAPKCLKIFTEIATKCVADRGSERPSMEDVLDSLKLALRLQNAYDLQKEANRRMVDDEQLRLKIASDLQKEANRRMVVDEQSISSCDAELEFSERYISSSNAELEFPSDVTESSF